MKVVLLVSCSLIEVTKIRKGKVNILLEESFFFVFFRMSLSRPNTVTKYSIFSSCLLSRIFHQINTVTMREIGTLKKI